MAKDQDIWLYRYSASPATFFITVCYFAAEAVDYICDQNDSTQSWHKINLQKKIWCLKSICCAQTEFTPSFKVGWVFKFLLMDLSLSGVCRNSFVRKSEEKKNSSVGHQTTWGYTPHSTWKKKKVTGLEKNKILSVFGSDSGKLQTDAVVCFFCWWRYSLACMTY